MIAPPPVTRISKKFRFNEQNSRLQQAADILPSIRYVSNLLILWKFTTGFQVHFVVLDSYQFMNHSLYNLTPQKYYTYA